MKEHKDVKFFGSHKHNDHFGKSNGTKDLVKLAVGTAIVLPLVGATVSALGGLKH